MPGCARGRPTPSEEPSASSRSRRLPAQSRGGRHARHSLRLEVLVQRPPRTLERLQVPYTIAVRPARKRSPRSSLPSPKWTGFQSPSHKAARLPPPRPPTREGASSSGARGSSDPRRRCGRPGATSPSSPTSPHPPSRSTPFTVSGPGRARYPRPERQEGTGMEHCLSGSFSANGAWLQCAVLAHNLLRLTQVLGGLHDHHSHRPAVARTIRTRFVSLPGRLVNRSQQPQRLGAAAGWTCYRGFNTQNS